MLPCLTFLSLSACDGKKSAQQKGDPGIAEQASNPGDEIEAEKGNQPEAKASESDINSPLPPERLNGAKQRVDGAEKRFNSAPIKFSMHPMPNRKMAEIAAFGF